MSSLSNQVKALLQRQIDASKTGGTVIGGRRKMKKAGVLIGGAKKKSVKKAVKSKSTKTCNPWIEYVKRYAKLHNVSYSEALVKAGPSYHKGK